VGLGRAKLIYRGGRRDYAEENSQFKASLESGDFLFDYLADRSLTDLEHEEPEDGKPCVQRQRLFAALLK
jgi:hypothetical protein